MLVEFSIWFARKLRLGYISMFAVSNVGLTLNWWSNASKNEKLYFLKMCVFVIFCYVFCYVILSLLLALFWFALLCAALHCFALHCFALLLKTITCCHRNLQKKYQFYEILLRKCKTRKNENIYFELYPHPEHVYLAYIFDIQIKRCMLGGQGQK